MLTKKGSPLLFIFSMKLDPHSGASFVQQTAQIVSFASLLRSNLFIEHGFEFQASVTH